MRSGAAAGRCWSCLACSALLGLVLLPRIGFDADPLHTKNPNTEAMQTLYDLGDSPLTNPFTIDILAPDAAAAGCSGGHGSTKLPLVSGVLSINSFVPEDQQAKLALIADAATLMGPSLAPRETPAPATAGEIRQPLRARTTRSRRRWRNCRRSRPGRDRPRTWRSWRARPIRW